MSLESFEAFMTRIGQDETLRQELRDEAPEGMTFDQLAQAAAARGFAFSAADITGAHELSDAELAGVAGGIGSSSGLLKMAYSNEVAWKLTGPVALDPFMSFKLTTSTLKF